jgi:hypothetical protein
MATQLLDDLFQPFRARTFRQQHRLQRAGIIGKRVVLDHDSSRSWRAPDREHADQVDSLCRRSTRLRRRDGLARNMNAPPIEPLQQRRELRRRQTDHAVLHGRPTEGTGLEPFVTQLGMQILPLPRRSLSA